MSSKNSKNPKKNVVPGIVVLAAVMIFNLIADASGDDAVAIIAAIACVVVAVVVAVTMLAVKKGVKAVRTVVAGDGVSLETLAESVKNSGNRNGIATDITYTELHRASKQIAQILSGSEPSLREAMRQYKKDMERKIIEKDENIRNQYSVTEVTL